MLLFSPHHKFAIRTSRDGAVRSVKALLLTSKRCISYQQRHGSAATGVLSPVLGSCAVRHEKARFQHVCAAGSQPEQPQVQVAVLQDPSNAGNSACYVVGVSPNGGGAALNQIDRVIFKARDAGKQDVIMLLDTTAATAAVDYANIAEAAIAAGVVPPGEQPWHKSEPLQDYLQMFIKAYDVQLQILQPADGTVRSDMTAGPPSGATSSGSSSSSTAGIVGSSSSSSKSGSSGLSSLLAFGLGFARRTATAAVSAVEAAAAAANAAPEIDEQSGVDLVPDLPDLSLRMRRREWDPEQAVLSWHAAVLFCAMIKQLQDQGYEVELRDDDEFSPDMPKHIQEAILEAAFEEARQHDTFRSFEIIKLLLTQAAESLQQKEPAIGEEEMQHWIALLMAAEDPKVVVIELETMLEEQIAEHAALQTAGQESPVVLLPTAFDVAQRLDAKYSEEGEGSDGDSGSGDDDSDSEAGVEGDTGGGEQTKAGEEGKAPSSSSRSSSSSSSTEARPDADAEAGPGYVIKGLPAEPKDVTRIGPGSSKTDDAAPSSSSSRSAADAAGDAASSSSSGLAASDAVISARSNRQLVDAMMRLERNWNQARDASTDSSSSSGGSSSSSTGGSSKQGDKPVPELLPRPIRPPQLRGDAADSSSSSARGTSTDSASSVSTSSSSSSSSGRSSSSPGSAGQSGQGAAVAGSGSSATGSRVRRINRQAGPPAAAADGIGEPSATAGTSSSSSGASAAADAAADRAASAAGTDAAAAAGSSSSNSSQPAGSSETMSSSTAGDEQQQGSASEQLPGRSTAQEQPQQQQQQGNAAPSAGRTGSTASSELSPDQGADAAAAEADAQSIAPGSGLQWQQQSEEVPLLRVDDEAQLQRLVDERAAAVARSAAAAGGSDSRPAAAAASTAAGAAGDEGLVAEVDAAAFAQHIRDSFSQFEDYLASTGVELSREARIEAFTEIYEDDFDSDDELDELADAAERAAGGPWDHAQSWFQPEWWHAVIAGILNQDSGSSSSSGEAATAPADLDGKESKGQQQGSKGSQGVELLAARSNSSRSTGSGDGSSNGWDHIRSNFGQDGVDRLRDLLRGDSLLMTGVDINEMTILIAALNNLNHGERLSTAELRMVSRLLKESEPGAESSSSSSGAADASAKSEKVRKRQRAGANSRRSSSLTRPPGFNVSAKDMPYKQDTRAIRLPKPYGRKRREQVQLFLKQLRQQQQQRKLLRQQRATQLQLWRLQRELLQGQQQQAGAADGQQQQQQDPTGQSSLSRPSVTSISSSSSSAGIGVGVAGSSRRSRLAEAVKGFTAAWRQSMKDQEAAEQQQQRRLDEFRAQQAADEWQQQQQWQASFRARSFAAAVAERSGLSAGDVQAAVGWVEQLRGRLAAGEADAPVYIAVVPQQQLMLIEKVWQQGLAGLDDLEEQV